MIRTLDDDPYLKCVRTAQSLDGTRTPHQHCSIMGKCCDANPGMQHAHSRVFPRGVFRAGGCWRFVPLAAAILVSGCGTNVQYLMSEESRVLSEADPVTMAAEELANGLEKPVYAAEQDKDRACEFLHAAALERFQSKPGLGEQFVSDLSSVVVLLFPIPRVERCAEAVGAYGAAVNALSRQIDNSTAGDRAAIDSSIN